mmetsp:Transcript_121043/g.386597  ORF Transcript_121043/g.386597 Transcript_121043/m.386597 type:complete len:435 (+) Transcript_121043:73-1377(+)
MAGIGSRVLAGRMASLLPASLANGGLPCDSPAGRQRSLGEMHEKAQFQELGWSPAKLFDFIENSSNWVAQDGTILWANADELSTLGYTADEYIGKSIVDFHADTHIVHEILRRLTAGEILRDIPAQMIHKDGSIVHVRIDCSACFDEAGAFSHTRCFNRNVTAGGLEASERQKLDAHSLASASLELARREVDMKEALLHQMLPPKVAADLSAGRTVPFEAFDHVTLFFSDVQGFTHIAASVAPGEVINLLNVLYSVMDYCVSLFPIYKVETIGDCYMVVGGLPEPSSAHTEAIADFALLARCAVSQLVQSPVPGDEPLHLRMGIHSGPVVAGVVGSLMPRYCLFGDTVNTASRMESSGEAGGIQCSGPTADALHGSGLYVLEERGPIDVMGKGCMTTYWLVGGTEANNFASAGFLDGTFAQARALAECLPLQPS